ncbi:MAG: hypothetical protein ABEJ88_04385 [Halobacterium sp.]
MLGIAAGAAAFAAGYAALAGVVYLTHGDATRIVAAVLSVDRSAVASLSRTVTVPGRDQAAMWLYFGSHLVPMEVSQAAAFARSTRVVRLEQTAVWRSVYYLLPPAATLGAGYVLGKREFADPGYGSAKAGVLLALGYAAAGAAGAWFAVWEVNVSGAGFSLYPKLGALPFVLAFPLVGGAVGASFGASAARNSAHDRQGAGSRAHRGNAASSSTRADEGASTESSTDGESKMEWWSERDSASNADTQRSYEPGTLTAENDGEAPVSLRVGCRTDGEVAFREDVTLPPDGAETWTDLPDAGFEVGARLDDGQPATESVDASDGSAVRVVATPDSVSVERVPGDSGGGAASDGEQSERARGRREASERGATRQRSPRGGGGLLTRRRVLAGAVAVGAAGVWRTGAYERLPFVGSGSALPVYPDASRVSIGEAAKDRVRSQFLGAADRGTVRVFTTGASEPVVSWYRTHRDVGGWTRTNAFDQAFVYRNGGRGAVVFVQERGGKVNLGLSRASGVPTDVVVATADWAVVNRQL